MLAAGDALLGRRWRCPTTGERRARRAVEQETGALARLDEADRGVEPVEEPSLGGDLAPGRREPAEDEVVEAATAHAERR